MTDAAAPRSLNCPNCGAPLDFPPGQSSVRCRFCDSTIERSVSDLTDDDDANIINLDSASLQIPASEAGPARRFVIKMRNGQPVVIEVGKPPAPAPTSDQMYNAARLAAARRQAMASTPPAKGSAAGCVITIAAIVGVALLIAVISFAANPQAGLIVQLILAGKFDEAFANSRTLGANIQLTQSGVLAPGPNDGPDQALLLTSQYPASGSEAEYRLIALDTTARKLLWQSAALDPKLYDTRILYDADRVYLISGLNLVALNRADGATVWTTPLADQISLNICRDCLQLLDGRLAALSDDGTLEVFDAATGESQWQVTAVQDSPRGLYVIGDRLAFMDRDDSAQGFLRAFDPATGEEQTVQPACTGPDDREEYSDWTTPLVPAPDGQSVYLAFGYSPSCVQKLDAGTLDLIWTNQVPDDFSGSIESVLPVLADDTLYLAASHQVLAVDAESGDVHGLVNSDDYEFAIAAVHGSDLILQARRNRGSTRYELWDVDSATGDTRWTFDLGDNPPVEPADIIDEHSPSWQVQPTAAGLRVLRFQAAADDKSHAILNETLDWQTGQSGGQTTTVLGLPTIIFDAPAWQVWQGDTLWMVIENDLLAFDASANKVVSRWP